MSMKLFQAGKRALTMTLVLGILPGLSGGVSESRAGGPRLTVSVSEPFEFQGRVWPATTLSVMPVATYNPSASLDEIWIGAECLGRMVAHRRPVGSPATQDVVVFERNADQRLVLVGYALRGTSETYRYRPSPSVAGEAGDGRAGIGSLR